MPRDKHSGRGTYAGVSYSQSILEAAGGGEGCTHKERNLVGYPGAGAVQVNCGTRISSQKNLSWSPFSSGKKLGPVPLNLAQH